MLLVLAKKLKNPNTRSLEAVNVGESEKMNENEINAKLKGIRNYLGSFAVNELSDLRIRYYPAYIITNLDNRWETGSHWVAIAIDVDHIYVCDSLGAVGPNHLPKDIINFLHLYTCNRQLHITRKLQKTSASTCGFYAIFFILYLQSHSFCDFLDSFTKDPSLNDALVQIYCK